MSYDYIMRKNSTGGQQSNSKLGNSTSKAFLGYHQTFNVAELLHPGGLQGETRAVNEREM